MDYFWKLFKDQLSPSPPPKKKFFVHGLKISRKVSTFHHPHSFLELSEPLSGNYQKILSPSHLWKEGGSPLCIMNIFQHPLFLATERTILVTDEEAFLLIECTLIIVLRLIWLKDYEESESERISGIRTGNCEILLQVLLQH